METQETSRTTVRPLCVFKGCKGAGQWRPWIEIPGIDQAEKREGIVRLELDLLICDNCQKTAERDAFLTVDGQQFLVNYLALQRPDFIPELDGAVMKFFEVYPRVRIVTH
jgi:hypothetical protein